MQKKDKEIMEKYSIARTKYGAAVDILDRLLNIFAEIYQDTFTKRDIQLIITQSLLSLSKANKKILTSGEKKHLKEIDATIKDIWKRK